MDCPILKENEELKEQIKSLKQKHTEDIDRIRQMLVDKKNNKKT